MPDVERVDEPFVGAELPTLVGFLEWERRTLLYRCAGLTGEQLAQRSAPPSALSLLGLIRHVTEVERTWFRCRFAGEDVSPVYARDDCPDAAFTEVDPDRAEADHQRLLAEWDACRAAVAAASLDDRFEHPRWGAMSLRWLYVHLIREYAGHKGHADLLRERIDGVTFD